MHRAYTSSRVGRTIWSLVAAGVLALGASSCGDTDGSADGSTAPDAKKAQTTLEAGLKAHADGDLADAAADYEQTLKYDPDNKFAFYNLALIDEEAGNYGLAEENYREALKSDPAYEPALFNLAILVTTSDPEEAISLYEKAVAADPKDASAWMNLGLLLRADGDAADGDAAVQRAIKLNPQLKDPAA